MTRRDCGARLLAGAIVLTSSLTSASVAGATSTHTHHASHAHDDSYDSLYYDSGYSADYGGVTIGSGTDFYYDPGSSCDASICNSAFYDPSTNFYYDPSGQTSIDSAGAFDNYITEGGNPDTISARAGSGRDALKTLGHELGTLSTSTAAPARAAQAPQTGMQAMTLPGGLARAITQTGGAHRPVSAWVGTARQPALVAGLIHAATTPRLRPATAVGARAAIFVDTPRTYKLTYPSAWPLITHNAYVKGAFVDMRIVAPDANAGVAAQSATLPQGMAFSLTNPAVQQYFYNAIGASLSAFGAQVTQQMQIQVSQTGGGDKCWLAVFRSNGLIPPWPRMCLPTSTTGPLARCSGWCCATTTDSMTSPAPSPTRRPRARKSTPRRQRLSSPAWISCIPTAQPVPCRRWWMPRTRMG